nr:PREDICTED: RCC1 and BTB domain-containing protein 1-like [Linepithema humile]XP_012231286.1 PREDICTED: RCC1 and BTB domain-containing protein 1-like [Linepithema humile]
MQKNEERNLQSQSANVTHFCNLKKILNFWPGLNYLTQEFLCDIHMIMAIGCEMNITSMNVFIIVKKDGYVYSYTCDDNKRLKSNCNNYFLPLYNTMDVLYYSTNPQIIENLCGKNIKTFVQMDMHGLFALTNEGKVYSWGDNKLCTLGHEERKIISKPTLVTSLSNKNIVNLVCGISHALALTDDGKVYIWGNIAEGGQTPQQISDLENKKIVCIACGLRYSIVVTDNGEVYICGRLFNSTSRNVRRDIASFIISRDFCRMKQMTFAPTIIKVACGLNHALALTDEGILYVWGENSFGQLGTGDKKKIYKPFLLNTSDMGELSDIAALSTKNISVAVNKNGCFYVWGDWAGRITLQPKATLYTNMNDVFTCENIMYKPLILTETALEYVKKESNTMRYLKDAFNDPSTSDFKVEVEGRDIHLHKAVLKVCSLYFRTMFQHTWKENIENVLKLDMFSYNVYEAFFKYLYTSEIEISSEEAFELFKLADMYNETDLKTACIPIIQREVTISNVALFYSKAIGYNVQWLEEFCFSFAMRNVTKMTQMDSFKELAKNTKFMFLIKADEANALKT